MHRYSHTTSNASTPARAVRCPVGSGCCGRLAGQPCSVGPSQIRTCRGNGNERGGIPPALKSQTSAPKDGRWFFVFFGRTLGFGLFGLSVRCFVVRCCACSRKQFRGRETGEVAAAAVLRHPAWQEPAGRTREARHRREQGLEGHFSSGIVWHAGNICLSWLGSYSSVQG